MLFSSTIKSSGHQQEVVVRTESESKVIAIPAKANGQGSSVNGAELLFLSLATCYCNDIYREAAKRKIIVDAVEVTVKGEFGSEGEAAKDISYEVDVKSSTLSEVAINELIDYVDNVAEIHNTLRRGIAVTLRKK
jgi:uncharacterized OsmC-like protein